MAGNEVIICNKCEKRISAKGILVKTLTEGEHQVQYFTCPHCGERYQITTTDERQRELIEGRGKELEKRNMAIRLRFRVKTIKGHWETAQKIERDINERALALKAVGEKILHQEETEENGQINGKGGATSI